MKLQLPPGSAYVLTGPAQGRTAWCAKQAVAHQARCLVTPPRIAVAHQARTHLPVTYPPARAPTPFSASAPPFLTQP